jgi:uncharacterized protein with FMN-binding domain
MKLMRTGNAGLSVLTIILVLAIASIIVGTTGAFHNAEWIVFIGLALFVLAGVPALRRLTGRSQSEDLILERRGSGKKISNSLIAASSAAILAVYAAGYDRTSAAADRFAAETAAPRRHSVAAALSVDPPSVPTSIESPITLPVQSPAAETIKAKAEVAVVAAPRSPEPEPQATLTSPRTPDETTAPALALVPPPPAIDAPRQAPAIVQSGTNIPNAAIDLHAAEPVAPPPPPPVVQLGQFPYPDGAYLGWGICRHGSIQVQVVLRAGRIASADITQCQTRYPCSVIRNTPAQMVSRQNPEALDNVSGATQSVDAYYGAVMDALKDAKKKLK